VPETIDIKKISEWGIPFQTVMFIAGPCSAESEDQLMQTALGLKDSKVNVMRAGIWKPRTRPGSFEGVGAEGLKWLKNAGNAINVPVTTEVATPEHVEACLKAGIDILWIGARTTTNPFAVQAVADALKGVDIPVIIKNPINPDIELWAGALERLNRVGIKRLAVIHRGFSIYEKSKFRNQPIWRIPIELKHRNPQLPMFCDPSHICGNRELLLNVAQNAMDLLFDGLMLEVHIDPPAALSDAKQQLTPEGYNLLLSKLKIKKLSSESEDFKKHIKTLRLEIDKLDHQLLELLAKRMSNAKEIAIHKMNHNISLFQPGRFDETSKSWVKEGRSLSQDLSEDFLSRMYRFIHEESLRIQEKALED
jgi:chorismate mutase